MTWIRISHLFAPSTVKGGDLMALSACCGSAKERWNDGTLHCSECGRKC